jgi:CheY-like chemotaxis protein
MSNALKFTKEGTITLILELISNENNTIKLKFFVNDTGIGLNNDMVNKIFNEFEQADNSTTRNYGGTGLGLTISKRLVELMGGEIWVESTKDKGSQFIFTIELENRENNNLEEKSYLFPLTNQNKLQGKHLLIAEDDQINQLVISGILESIGISVDIVNNGEEALNIFTKGKYDLILMDTHMPIMNGIIASQNIRNIDAHIPILSLSVAVLKEDQEKTKEAGMNGHISKPITKDILIKALLKFIK